MCQIIYNFTNAYEWEIMKEYNAYCENKNKEMVEFEFVQVDTEMVIIHRCEYNDGIWVVNEYDSRMIYIAGKNNIPVMIYDGYDVNAILITEKE